MKLRELFESLNSKIEFNVIDKTKKRYKVYCDISKDKKITIYANFMVSQDKWEIGFFETFETDLGIIKSFDKTGTGEELKVFSALKKFLETFIKIYNPKTIYFESDKEDKSAKTFSRTKLYKRLIQKYSKNMGYDSITKENGRFYDEFTLTKI